MDEQLLRDIANDIGETKGMVRTLVEEMKKTDEALNQYDRRLRRIENIFLPAVIIIGIIIDKVINVFS